MADVKIRYFVEKPGRTGPRHFWQPSKHLSELGWRPIRLSDDRAEAIAEAEQRNKQLDQWRRGAKDQGSPAAVPPASDTLDAIWTAFKTSPKYRRLRAKTQTEYAKCYKLLKPVFGDVPVAAIRRRRILDFYDGMYERTPYQANAVIRVMRRLLEFARDQDVIEINPAVRPKLQTPKQSQRYRFWPEWAPHAMAAAADKLNWHSVGTAILLNEWLGQCQGDLLALPAKAYRDGTIYIRQSKTGAELSLPVDLVDALKQRLDAERARQHAAKVTATTLLVCETTGRKWEAGYFRTIFRQVRAAAIAAETDPHRIEALEHATFKHLRHTAVTRLGECECTDPEIRSVSGHSLQTISEIIEVYMAITGKMAANAFKKRLKAERR